MTEPNNDNPVDFFAPVIGDNNLVNTPSDTVKSEVLPTVEGDTIRTPEVEEEVQDKKDVDNAIENQEVSGNNAEILTANSPLTHEEDGKIKDERGRTRTYIGGRPVMIGDEDASKYQEMLMEVNRLQDGRTIADIPDDDDYYKEREKLDKFAGRFS
jgi:hypothetical protein